MKSHPFCRHIALVLVLSHSISTAADPAWWTTRGVKNASAASNLSPATIGQAKHMAAMALAELDSKLPSSAFAALQSDLTPPLVDLTPPKTQADFDNQRALLLNGQLKALAKPFYDRLRALDAAWVDSEMASANIRVVEPGSSPATYSPYPWSESASDDSNKSPATVGQLKAVFSLRLENMVTDSDGDGLPDAWEIQYFSNLSQNGSGDPDGDGLSNAVERAFGFNPAVSDVNTDSDADGLPDVWEIQYFANLSQNGSGDPDGDGLGNAVERSFGFNPAVSDVNTDSDGDGLPDVWEIQYFSNLSQNGNGDPDGDGLSNAVERSFGFNPAVSDVNTDSDADGLPDVWEIQYFSNLSQNGSGDPDGDGLSNAVERSFGFDPTVSNSTTDSDGDGLPDVWEIQYFSSLSQIATGDTDGDGLSNAVELANGFNPSVSDIGMDSDGDGLPDVWEIRYFSSLSLAAEDDPDSDGLTNLQEATIHGTDPTKKDTDGDGLADLWEVDYGLDPRDAGSVNPANGPDGDPDGDGLKNIDEFITNANPHDDDSDGDGISDGDEFLIYHTYPAFDDSDGDGLTDYQEIITYGANPLEWDTDGDWLNDGDEVILYGTDPTLFDTDGDWMPDDWELDHELDPNDAADGLLDADSDGLANQLEYVFIDKGYDPFVANSSASFPWSEDPDYDGLTTALEFNTHLTNPRQPDMDDDGMGDGWEIRFSFNAKTHNSKTSNPNDDWDADPDGDNLTNGQESVFDTDPNNPDTDGDGINDDVEIGQGTNPNDPNDHEPPPGGTVTVNVEFGDHSGSHSEKYRVKLQPVEGDTQVRERSNRAYGNVQTDTFHLPKGAKYTVTLVHIGTDPKYRNQPNPDFDYTLNFTSSGSDPALKLITDDSQSILGVHDESDQFFASGKTATLYTATLVSETVATMPSDRKRKKVGVGEEVNLTLTPASLPSPVWALEGASGTSVLNPLSGTASALTAGERACTPKVKVTTLGSDLSIDFNAIEPSAVTLQAVSPTSQTTPSLGLAFFADVYIGPDDVNFQFITVQEGQCAAVASNYFAYQNGLVHPPTASPISMTQTVVQSLGTKMSGRDTVSGGTNGSPYSSGVFTWSIPWSYYLGGNSYQFAIATHQKIISINNSKATLSISKNGASNNVTEP